MRQLLADILGKLENIFLDFKADFAKISSRWVQKRNCSPGQAREQTGHMAWELELRASPPI